MFLIGNLTQDLELNHTNSGISCCTFRIAVNRQKKSDGTQDADFFTVQTWRGLAENCVRNLSKGSKIAVHGELRSRSYTNNAGIKVNVTEVLATHVEFLSPRKPSADGEPEDEIQKALESAQGQEEFVQVDDDGLPF